MTSPLTSGQTLGQVRSDIALDGESLAAQPARQGATSKIGRAVIRFIKLGGSILYYVVATARCAIAGIHGKPVPETLVVLCYHAVPRKQRARFARQMDILRRHATPVRADFETALPPGARFAAVTFDDGYQSTVENALPELAARNIPCTLFVVSHQSGQTPWWSGTDGYDREEKFATEEHLARVSNDLVAIGSHTMTHPDLSTLPDEEAMREPVESKEHLQQNLRREVQLFAFPHGVWNEAIVGQCRRAGYQRAFSIDPTVSRSGSSNYVTGRVLVDPSDWEIEFRLKLLGAYQWLPVAYRAKRRIVRMVQMESADH